MSKGIREAASRKTAPLDENFVQLLDPDGPNIAGPDPQDLATVA